ncbi:MAG TPA: class I SAM-dependent methyltransferase [Pyrinomonadaceae bacterium]|nr:class I SAM-dependent methyltransferase [Pyrinomonadaceae bacterium]
MDKIYKNYFSPKTAAERFAKGRPRFHSFVIGKIKEFLSLEKPLLFALDVGCGTGFSTAALKEIAQRVIGLDISAEMLAWAEKENGVEYILASAENLPLGGDKFDLITISQAIHWVDKDKFFKEADRVLKREGWLIAYDNYFSDQAEKNPAFGDWHQQEFLKKYPVPPRAEISFETTSENPNDFVLARQDWHENIIEFSAAELVDFLVTMSNVIAAVEGGTQSIEEVREWLSDGVKPFFKEDERKPFTFKATIWYLRRAAF